MPAKDQEQSEVKKTPASTAPAKQSRRAFLSSAARAGGLSMLGATGIGSTLVGASASADDFSPLDQDPALNVRNRATRAAKLKKSLASIQLLETLKLPEQLDNDDELRYEGQNFYASFHKGLAQNNFGEVDPEPFNMLRQALRSGAQNDFYAIPLSSSAQRKLANPQGALRFEITGLDSHACRMPPAPTFRGATAAAEMGELYWQALTRDLPFIDYPNHELIADAINDLNGFSATVGPKQAGQVTVDTLFRGGTSGDLNGPYISQLLLKDVPYGPSTIVQHYQSGAAGIDYMVDEDNWLHIQRGGNPLESFASAAHMGYIHNNRALSEYVHRDMLFQAYFNAALILLGLGSQAFDPQNPYLASANQSAFTSLGAPWLLQLLTYASNLALSGAWFQKWRVHRRLRPETFGGRIEFRQTANRSYEVHPDILNSAAISRNQAIHGTAFLPMAYTEGSPMHPAYPAGHACVAGACCTVLKAFFNEEFIFPDTVQADATGLSLLPYTESALTVGGEINKLANNISIGRNAAGVHYRSDGDYGLEVGEQQAIGLLRDQLQLLNEDFPGFNLTKFNGEKITIRKYL